MQRGRGLFVKLDKTPPANGRTIGRASRAVLRARVRATRRIQKKHNIAERIIAARVRDFERLVKRVDKSWLDETAGVAQGAGLALDDILMLNCLPPGFYSPGHDCTTFMAVGIKENRLLKIRDERNNVQSFYISHAMGRKRYQGGHDIGDVGTAHFFNDSAVAGASNTGSHIAAGSDAPRFDDRHVMRYFAENARSVEDIPKLFERLVELGAAGGARHARGAIFAFVDRNGGLLLETAFDACSIRRIEKGTLVVSNHFVTPKAKKWESAPPDRNTLTRKRRMEELLRRCNWRPSLQEVFAFTRDRKNRSNALCNDDGKHFWMTLSAQLQVVSRDAPDASTNYICCGNTRHSLFVPAPLALEETFLPFLSGAFYKAAARCYGKYRCNAHLRKAQREFESGMPGRTDHRALYSEAMAIVRRAAAT